MCAASAAQGCSTLYIIMLNTQKRQQRIQHQVNPTLLGSSTAKNCETLSLSGI